MVSPRAFPIFGLVALAVGIIVAVFLRRVPKRGWVGIALVLVSAVAWAFIESGESSRPSSLPMFLMFLFIAPVAVVYAFRARRAAPDRVAALAAFVGSFIVGAFLLFMLAGIVYSLFML
jgi:hypothetical protein